MLQRRDRRGPLQVGSAGAGVREIPVQRRPRRGIGIELDTRPGPEIGGDGHLVVPVPIQVQGIAIDHQRFDKIPRGRAVGTGERAGQDPTGPAVRIGPRELHRVGREVSGIARKRGEIEVGVRALVVTTVDVGDRPTGGSVALRGDQRAGDVAEIDTDVAVQRGPHRQGGGDHHLVGQPRPVGPAARPRRIRPDRLDHGGGDVDLDHAEDPGPHERLEDGHRRRDEAIGHDTTSGRCPSNPSLSSTTAAAGTRQENTPWVRPSGAGVSGPTMPRTNK